MPYHPEEDDDEPDAADGAGAWEGWMDPKSIEDLLRRDLVIEEAEQKRKDRLIDAVMRQVDVESDRTRTYRLMSRVWDQIQESLRQSQSR